MLMAVIYSLMEEHREVHITKFLKTFNVSVVKVWNLETGNE